jgi:hypothetical protein
LFAFAEVAVHFVAPVQGRLLAGARCLLKALESRSRKKCRGDIPVWRSGNIPMTAGGVFLRGSNPGTLLVTSRWMVGRVTSDHD